MSALASAVIDWFEDYGSVRADLTCNVCHAVKGLGGAEVTVAELVELVEQHAPTCGKNRPSAWPAPVGQAYYERLLITPAPPARIWLGSPTGLRPRPWTWDQ